LRAPTGFEEAFDGLFGRAFRVAMRILRDPTAAEDVAAETMARNALAEGKPDATARLVALVEELAGET